MKKYLGESFMATGEKRRKLFFKDQIVIMIHVEIFKLFARKIKIAEKKLTQGIVSRASEEE